MRRRRCETLVKWSYSIVYYTFSTLWAYHILLKADILPSFLGGKGIEESWIKNKYSIPQATTEMKIFYMVQFGKHFGRFLNHCFIRREGHLYEYALHHGVSSVLISFSFLTNQWLVGILVLFIHDMSEITFIIGRGYAVLKCLCLGLQKRESGHSLLRLFIGAGGMVGSQGILFLHWMYKTGLSLLQREALLLHWIRNISLGRFWIVYDYHAGRPTSHASLLGSTHLQVYFDQSLQGNHRQTQNLVI